MFRTAMTLRILILAHLAWTFLHKQQAKAEPALRQLLQSDNPVYREAIRGRPAGRGA